MGLWLIVLISGAVYFALHFFLVPALASRWNAETNLGKYTKIGTVALSRVVESTAKIVFLVFLGAFILLSLVALVAPTLGGSILQGLHSTLAPLSETLGNMNGLAERAILLLSLSGLLYFAWSWQKRDLNERLDDERQRQIDELLAGDAELEPLEPSPEMDAIAENIGACDAVLADLEANEDNQSQDNASQVSNLRENLVQQYAFLDLDRRLDLSNVSADDSDTSNRTWLDHIRIGLFSKGTQNTASGIAKMSSRAMTAVACLLAIGMSAPVLAAQGFAPTLNAVNDAQVFATQDQAEESLKSVARAASASTPVQESEELSQAYSSAARHFTRALVGSDVWRQSAARVVKNVPTTRAADTAGQIGEELAIRENLLDQYSVNSRERINGLNSSRIADVADLPDGQRRSFANFQSSISNAPTMPKSTKLEGRVEAWLRAKGNASANFRQRIVEGARSFTQPATARDFIDGVVGNALSEVADSSLPDPLSDGLFDQRARATLSEGIESGADRMLKQRLSTFIDDIAGGKSYVDALGTVKSGANSAAFRTADSARLKDLFISSEIGAEDMRILRAQSHPSLTRDVGERRLARANRTMSQMSSLARNASSQAIRRSFEGTVGSYEDLFPGRATGASQTALGRALSNSFGDAGVQIAAQGAELAANLASTGNSSSTNARGGSRNFARLRGSVRVGGVLIGQEPTTDADPQITDLTWTIDGEEVALSLSDGDGMKHALGSYSGEMIQQALAYAADGRPTTVTMTSGSLVPSMLKVHLHPSLVGSKLGCQMIELDRFVDAATGSREPRQSWDAKVRMQLTFHNLALDDDATKTQADRWSDAELLQRFALAFPSDWDSKDPTQSVFAHQSARFDTEVVEELLACKASQGPKELRACINSAGLSGYSNSPQDFAVWSGVRERPYSGEMGQYLNAFDRSGEAPLRFMAQVAFSEEIDPSECLGEDCTRDNSGPKGPWEFPAIAQQLEEQTLAFASSNGKASTILHEAQKFTALQRLFRSALEGRLGASFPRDKLISLMRDAAEVDPIEPVITPDWNQSRGAAQSILSALGNGQFGNPEEPINQASIEYVTDLLADGSRERFSGSNSCSAGRYAL